MLEKPSTIERANEEEPKERMVRLQQRVWDNLRNSGPLQQILNHSQHADDPSKYNGTNFWTEISTSRKDHRAKMWLQILIEHDEHHQPVTPKLYRITQNPAEQKRLSEQIWQGITEDDLRFVAKLKADDYHARDQKAWLSPEQSQAIKVLFPAIEKGEFSVELLPDFAQYCFAAEIESS